MTTVAAVEARTVWVPLAEPIAFATRHVTGRCYTLVRVRGADGSQGIGLCYAGNRPTSVVSAAVRELIAPVLVGADARAVEARWAEVWQETLLLGRAGAVVRALSAVDIALWDRTARAASLPLAQLLGASCLDVVGAYASGGYYRDGDGPEAVVEELTGYVKGGFAAVKIKVGRLDPFAEAERVAAAREAIGPHTLLLLDANNAYPDLASALHAVRLLEPSDPYWIEEPFAPDEVDLHARLAERTDVAVATGEIEAGRWRFRELLERRAASVLQPDVAVCGGVTEFRRIAATAASFGVPVAPHWFHALHVHLVAATPNASLVEYFADDLVFNVDVLLDRRLEVRDGGLVVPDGPGLGVLFDPDAVERHAVDAWS